MERAEIGRLLIGFALGAITGLLMTPQSGKVTRAQITKAAGDGRGSILEYGRTVQGTLVGAVEQSKGFIARQKRGVTEAIKQGSEVYRRTLT